jgi:hypothetical protein
VILLTAGLHAGFTLGATGWSQSDGDAEGAVPLTIIDLASLPDIKLTDDERDFITEVGDNKGVLDGMVHGEGGAIALNVRFLGEALNAIKTPQIVIETQTAQNPGVFKPVGAEGYLHIVMPMTVR